MLSLLTKVNLLCIFRNFVRDGVTVDEMKKHFLLKRDKDLRPIFGVSPTTISNWRNKGIPMLWQQAIQLKSNNVLVARIEDVKLTNNLGEVYENQK